jgi:hypothetical protein
VHAFYRHWIVANGSSEALGLGTTFLIRRAVAPWLASRSPADTLLGAAVAAIYAVCGAAGLLVGAIHGRVLVRLLSLTPAR